MKAEAASVIAHITSPNIDNYHHLLGFIEHMEDLLRELTGLCVNLTRNKGGDNSIRP